MTHTIFPSGSAMLVSSDAW